LSYSIFSKWGDRPVPIDAVAVEAAADVIVEAAHGHRVEGFLEHLEILLATGSVVRSSEHAQARGLGNFWPEPKPPCWRSALRGYRVRGRLGTSLEEARAGTGLGAGSRRVGVSSS